MPFFFEDAGGYQGDASAVSPTYVDDFVSSHDGLRLAKAFMGVRLIYCVANGSGGTDFATVTLNVIPVADAPAVTVEVLDACRPMR